MSQAPNPFTQAASQGYGEFAATIDEDDQEENHVVDEEEPQSPEPEVEEEQDEETNEHGFTQTQERSYPTGIESPDEDENENQVEMSDHEQEREDDVDDEQAGPSSPAVEDAEASNEHQEDDDDDEDTNKKQTSSQPRRRVQIMDDSDNEDEPKPASPSVVSKDKNRNFLKQFTMKHESSPKKHKKRRSDEQQHHEKKSKRFRQTSNDEEDDNAEEQQQQQQQQEKDTENVEATSDVEDVVDDIFGKDVNENEEEGDDQEEVAAELADLTDDEAVRQDDEEEEEGGEEQQTFDAEEDDDDEAPVRKDNYANSKNNVMYDIDLFLEKRAEQRRGNRRRAGKNGDVDLAGPDGDQFVSKLIDQMKIATEEDRIFNKSRQPATAKLLLLPTIEQHLCRADLSEIFLDNGVLTVFKDWLSPLPDKSLPNIKIRESLIRILQQFGTIHADPLRDSGIGKALMYLYKHPRETKENKIKLIKIIHDWARPIFNLSTDYKLLSRAEREQRDTDRALLKRQTSSTGKPKNRSADMDLPFASNRRQDDDDDEDCPRARVPRPSNKDYVVRPASSVDYSEKKGDGKTRTISRLDALKRRQQDQKRLSKPMSIVKLSIEGNKMHL